jgi:hypothetical protein
VIFQSIANLGAVVFNSEGSNLEACGGIDGKLNQIIISGNVNYGNDVSNNCITIDSKASVHIEGVLNPPPNCNYLCFGGGYLYLKGNKLAEVQKMCESDNIKIWDGKQWVVTKEINCMYDEKTNYTSVTGGQPRFAVLEASEEAAIKALEAIETSCKSK